MCKHVILQNDTFSLEKYIKFYLSYRSDETGKPLKLSKRKETSCFLYC